MVDFHVKKGLDLKLPGIPEGDPKCKEEPDRVALDLRGFPEVRFKSLVNEGDKVSLGQPLAFDRTCPQRQFVSPGGGYVKQIERGKKRALLSLIIQREEKEAFFPHSIPNWKTATRETLVSFLCDVGFFAHIQERPFDHIGNPTHLPKSIFVKALETAPLVPSAERQVEGHEAAFEEGLFILKRLTKGPVHLIHHRKSKEKAFTQAKGVEVHTVNGLHPSSHLSIFIQLLSPILDDKECVWTLSVLDVITLGSWFLTSRYFIDRLIAVAGPSAPKEALSLYRARLGVPLSHLVPLHLIPDSCSIVSGDPLMGHSLEKTGFLGFNHTVFSFLNHETKRRFLSFLRLKLPRSLSKRLWGEQRAIVDGTPYEAVMPLDLSTELLLKAVLVKDYEKADALGLLEVAPEDFALPAYVCPSKVELVEIIKEGLLERALLR